MSTTTSVALITSTFGGFGVALLAIVSLMIGVAIGMLVFRIGWKHINRAGDDGWADWKEAKRQRLDRLGWVNGGYHD